jgi:hypothetical protein
MLSLEMSIGEVLGCPRVTGLVGGSQIVGKKMLPKSGAFSFQKCALPAKTAVHGV